MARTRGHGNPKWSRDEIILALNLYFELDGRIPSARDKRICELSSLLRRFPYHAEASKKESFRNPDGVAFKLQNLRQVATGKGFGNVSEMDRQVWFEFDKRSDEVRALAELIRTGIDFSGDLRSDNVEEVEFVEGRVVTELHFRRERNAKIRDQLLSARRINAKLFCEMCGVKALSSNPALQYAHFEAHHIIPLASSGGRTTRLSDMALLCANCHRLLHKAISAEGRWLSISEGKQMCGLPSF